ncbi:MAG: peptide chain release factor N(5)-glutamine methyltransferase [Rhizobiales bacterium]|nr:peptide chain release factor N(5)-glutamine methyltransferase [Hyphomicrobiales bacterium]
MTPAFAAGITIEALRRRLAEEFRTAGIESPELDARLLLQAALGLDHAALITAQTRNLDDSQVASVNALAARRLTHEPIARILGEKEFWGLPLQVTPAVLVQRPETETVVAEVLRCVDAAGRRAQPLRILDIGTGSGAILLALLNELPNAFGVGTDISTAALAVAHANAHRHSLAGRAVFVACDLGAALSGGFDFVVSNPPYIASGAIAELMPDVREFDPRGALDGGLDGLDAYRRIAADAPRLTARQGRVFVEIGAGQGDAVVTLFTAAGLIASRAEDFAGITRVIGASRAP